MLAQALSAGGAPGVALGFILQVSNICLHCKLHAVYCTLPKRSHGGGGCSGLVLLPMLAQTLT